MKFDLSFIISLAAIVVMVFCLMQVFKLGKTVPGGIVGKAWRQLSALVILFTAGYLVTPFFSLLPAEVINPIVSLIFLFGEI